MEFALELLKDIYFPHLSPNQIDFIDFFFIMQKPPKPCFEQWPYHNRIVSFTHENFVMSAEFLGLGVCLILLYLLDILFVHFFLWEKVVELAWRFILLLDCTAPTAD